VGGVYGVVPRCTKLSYTAGHPIHLSEHHRPHWKCQQNIIKGNGKGISNDQLAILKNKKTSHTSGTALCKSHKKIHKLTNKLSIRITVSPSGKPFFKYINPIHNSSHFGKCSSNFGKPKHNPRKPNSKFCEPHFQFGKPNSQVEGSTHNSGSPTHNSE
jgi:hypothetical protein